MKPALLADILRDPAAVAERCVCLRQSLPHANVSQMLVLQPSILLEVPLTSTRMLAGVYAVS